MDWLIVIFIFIVAFIITCMGVFAATSLISIVDALIKKL